LMADYELSYSWSFYTCALLQFSPVIFQLFLKRKEVPTVEADAIGE